MLCIAWPKDRSLRTDSVCDLLKSVVLNLSPNTLRSTRTDHFLQRSSQKRRKFTAYRTDATWSTRSMRRFRVLPSAVSLVDTGRASP